MLAGASSAIDLDTLLKTHWNVRLSREAHQFLDARAVSPFCDDERIERTVCFECFANGVDSGETVHVNIIRA
jgi:hypothetical protein